MTLEFARRTAAAVLALIFLGLAAASFSAQAAVHKPVLKPQLPPIVAKKQEPTAGKPQRSLVQFTSGHVYIMRGLANVFSRGMDKLADELKAQGVPVSLFNHSLWQNYADDIIRAYKANDKSMVPIVLVGHSLGADASLVMANWLAQNGVPVRLVVSFDGVAEISPLSGAIAEVINYYKPHGYGQEVKVSPRFTGILNNVDLTERKDIGHLNIDKDPTLHQETIAKIVEIMKNDGKSSSSTRTLHRPTTKG